MQVSPDQLHAVAVEAGAAILAVYHRAGAVAVEDKADASPLTEADRAAHVTIVESLGTADAEIPVVSEEDGFDGDRSAILAGNYWLVDPLDGTKEFLKRTGEFTVNIARVRDGVPVAAVVHAPALGASWVTSHTGAERWDHHGRSPIHVCALARPDALRIRGEPRSRRAAGRSAACAVARRADGRHGQLAQVLRGWREGRADLYFRDGPTMPWTHRGGSRRAARGLRRSVRSRWRAAPLPCAAPAQSLISSPSEIARSAGPRFSAPPGSASKPILRGHLSTLETGSIPRDARSRPAQFERPALLFSGGKDSICLLRLRRKSVPSGEIPVPAPHIDTGHNFPEADRFRDRRAKSTRRQAHRPPRPGRDRQRHAAPSDRRGQPQHAPDPDAARRASRNSEVRLPRSVARAATRKRPAPRSASSAPRPRSASGIRRTSGPRSGTCTTAASNPGENFRVFPISQLDRDGRLGVHRARADRRCPRSISHTGADVFIRDGTYWPLPSSFPV